MGSFSRLVFVDDDPLEFDNKFPIGVDWDVDVDEDVTLEGRW